MPSRCRWPLVTGALGAALALAAVITYVVVRDASGATANGKLSIVERSIPANGARLSAEVVTASGSTGRPLLVMPTSWGSAADSYEDVAKLFARDGYVVVAYAQRGFGGSTGEVDFAGRATQRDATTVISWALRHTEADPKRVAMMGISYGAGISLMTAAHDPRVRAVAALSTWADLAEAYDQYDTPNVYGLDAVVGSEHPTARFDRTVRRLRNTLLTAPDDLGPVVHSISAERSPENYVGLLNKNKPAILIANAFEDSLFNPRQLLPFYDALTTPKRLELAAGDHGGPEAGALSGQPNETVDDAKAWLDHYVRGTANGIDTEDPIILRDARSGQLHTYKTWPAATGKDEVALGAPGATVQSGDTTNPTWSATIRHAGADSGASSGLPKFGSSTTYTVPTVAVRAIKPTEAFVWNGPALSTPIVLAGTPTVHLGLSSTSRIATIYLHLYDVDAGGSGSLVSFQPYTASQLSAREPRHVTIDMQPIAWSVPSGHHLTLIIDTQDQRYQSMNRAGNSVTVSSTKTEPAWFAAPYDS